MDLVFAAEQYAQAQAAAVAAAHFYANAAAMNAATNPAISLTSQALLGPQQQLPLGPAFIAAGSVEPPTVKKEEPKSLSSSLSKRRRSHDEDDRGRDHRRNRRRSSSRHRDSRRDRSRERGRDSRRDRRDRSRSPRRRDRDRRERTPESEEDDKNIPPNNTIMIRGLAQHITENDIRQDIQKCGLAAKDIRLIRKKDTGASRGFAFIEFSNVEEAQSWMEAKQGVLMFKDQYRATMQYSLPREGRPGDPSRVLHDWLCGQCGVQNFRRRGLCFKCGGLKTVSDAMEEGSEEGSIHPTTCILLRGLDALTTEDSIKITLMKMSNLPIKSIRIAKDSLTNTSRGFCCVEMNTLHDAMLLHNQLLGAPPVIDDKLVAVSYYRTGSTSASSHNGIPHSNAPSSSSINSSHAANIALAAAQWSHKNTDDHDFNKNGENPKYTPEEIEKMAKYSASMYAKNSKEEAQYYEYYKNLYTNKGDASAAASVSQTSAKDAGTKCGTVTVNGVEYKRYPVPDVSSYQYDETSGYYYDPLSGLYYDSNSQYYYNSKTSQYYYWDAEHQTYLPASDNGGEGGGSGNKKKEDKFKDKNKTAKKIAKDMERWAKSMNQRKEAEKEKAAAAVAATTPAPSTLTSINKVSVPVVNNHLNEAKSSMNDVAFSAMLQSRTKPEPSSLSTVTGLAGISSYGSEDDSGGEDNEEEHTNWDTMACLLCKRQFTSKEKLSKHNQMSDLHKQNLINWKRERGSNPSSSKTSSQNNQYRDRAKERREKFGVLDEEPRPNKLKEKYLKVLEQAENTPSSFGTNGEKKVGSDNIGNKMLQKMGWKEGLGLGKSNQGRTSIIETGQRVAQAGLGSNGSKIKADPNDSYKDCVKKTMYQRFHQMD